MPSMTSPGDVGDEVRATMTVTGRVGMMLGGDGKEWREGRVSGRIPGKKRCEISPKTTFFPSHQGAAAVVMKN